MGKLKLVIMLWATMFFFNSCTTYYISVDSFKNQFGKMDRSNFKDVTVEGPSWDKVKYKTFPNEVVKCIDKKGNNVELKMKPTLEIRFTDTVNYRTTFYLDRIFVSDITISGRQSSFLNITKEIPLGTIKKIEVQNDGKSFHYVKR